MMITAKRIYERTTSFVLILIFSPFIASSFLSGDHGAAPSFNDIAPPLILFAFLFAPADTECTQQRHNAGISTVLAERLDAVLAAERQIMRG